MLDGHPLYLEYQLENCIYCQYNMNSVVECKVIEDSILNSSQNITEFP